MSKGSPLTPRPCRDDTCDVSVIVAARQPHGRWAAFEAADRNPSTQAAADCWVLIGTQAWRPADLVEQLMVSREIS